MTNATYRLRELDRLELGAEATRFGRRDILIEEAKTSPALADAIAGKVSIPKTVAPLVAVNRQLTTNKRACSGEEFEKFASDFKAKAVDCELLMRPFDPMFAWKDFGMTCLSVVLVMTLGTIGFAVYGWWTGYTSPATAPFLEIMSAVFTVMLLIIGLPVFTGSRMREVIGWRQNWADEAERKAAYLDGCIKDAFGEK